MTKSIAIISAIDDTFDVAVPAKDIVPANFNSAASLAAMIQRLVDEKIEGFTFLAVDCAEDRATVDRFLQEKGYTFSVAYDEDNAIGALYPTDGIPYTVFIKNGVIEKTFLGRPEDPYTEYKAAVEELLAK